MSRKNWFFSIFWIVTGTVLFVLSTMEIIDSTIWSGMGGGLIGVGIVQLVRNIRYRTNDSYRQKRDIENHDERNRYLANKAWAWAGYCYVLISAVGSLVLMILGRPEYQLVAGSMCLVVLLYWASYLILRRKY